MTAITASTRDADEMQARARAIIEQPIAALVEFGLEGSRQAAVRMLAFQYLIRLQPDADLEFLLLLRDEIDRAIAATIDETGIIH